MRFLGLNPVDVSGKTFKRASGCRSCEGIGYRGRLGLFELFEMDSDLRDATFRGETQDTIRDMGLSTGRLRPLIVAGSRKVLSGETSFNEILRVTRV